MERVRTEVHLGPAFSAEAFDEAFGRFAKLYAVPPLRAMCSPDVLARYCELFERSADVAMLHSSRIAYRGIPLTSAIMPSGTVAFEGEVDEERMGDW